MAINTPLLDRYDRMQSMPFGAFSAMEAGARKLGSQRAVMASALRKGIRNARKAGDFKTVAEGLGMSNAYGVTSTGIGSYDDRIAGDQTAYTDMQAKGAMNERIANQAAAGVDKIFGMPNAASPSQKPSVDPGFELKPKSNFDPGFEAKSGDNIDPGFTPQGGVAGLTDAGSRFVELTKRHQLSLDGAFGKDAQIKAKRKEAEAMVDSATEYEIGQDESGKYAAKAVVNEKKLKSLADRITQLGGTVGSFRSAVARRGGTRTA